MLGIFDVDNIEIVVSIVKSSFYLCETSYSKKYILYFLSSNSSIRWPSMQEQPLREFRFSKILLFQEQENMFTFVQEVSCIRKIDNNYKRFSVFLTQQVFCLENTFLDTGSPSSYILNKLKRAGGIIGFDRVSMAFLLSISLNCSTNCFYL